MKEDAVRVNIPKHSQKNLLLVLWNHFLEFFTDTLPMSKHFCEATGIIIITLHFSFHFNLGEKTQPSCPMNTAFLTRGKLSGTVRSYLLKNILLKEEISNWISRQLQAWSSAFRKKKRKLVCIEEMSLPF